MPRPRGPSGIPGCVNCPPASGPRQAAATAPVTPNRAIVGAAVRPAVAAKSGHIHGPADAGAGRSARPCPSRSGSASAKAGAQSGPTRRGTLDAGGGCRRGGDARGRGGVAGV
jgi:hypothetical protein